MGKRHLQITPPIRGYHPTRVKISYNSATTSNPVKKRAEDLTRHFFKENVQTANRHVEQCSASPIPRESQSKATTRHRLPPVRMAVINKTQSRCRESVEEKEPSCPASGMRQRCRQDGKQCGESWKHENQKCHPTPQFHS